MSWTKPDYSDLKDRRILIVEDEMLLAMDLEDLLETRGCTIVASVPDVERALLAIAEHSPEVVLLDMNLDGTSSAPVAKALLDQHIPFVMVTGYTGAGEMEANGIDPQQVPMVKKPYQEDILLRTLCTVLEKSG